MLFFIDGAENQSIFGLLMNGFFHVEIQYQCEESPGLGASFLTLDSGFAPEVALLIGVPMCAGYFITLGPLFFNL